MSSIFKLGDFIRNHLERSDDSDQPSLASFLQKMSLISLQGVTHEGEDFIHISGFASNVKKVARMIKFYNEYISKLGSIEQRIQ